MDAPTPAPVVTLDMRDPLAAARAFVAALPAAWRTGERWGWLWREAHRPAVGAAEEVETPKEAT